MYASSGSALGGSIMMTFASFSLGDETNVGKLRNYSF